MELYDFQKKATRIALNAIAAGKNPLLSSPTGTGKSLIGIDILLKLSSIGVLPYLMSSKKEILWGIEEKSRKLFGKKVTPLLWTPRRLLKRLKDGRIKKPHVIITDEAHHLNAPGWAVYRDVAKLVGLTATPLRGVEEQVVTWKSFFQEFHSCISTVEAILRGILVPFYFHKEHIGKIRLDNNSSQHQIRSLSKGFISSNKEKIFEDIMRLDDLQRRPTIFSTPNITSSLIIKNYFEKRGIPIAVISKDTGKKERAKYFDKLAKNETWLAAIDILTEGIDIPEISRVVCLRLMLSPITFVQLIGRGLRPSRNMEGFVTNGKVDCEIIDYSDNLSRFMGVLSNFLGISLLESEIDNKPCYIPNLKDIRHPVNDYKSVKFASLTKYSKIPVYFKKRDFVFDIGVIELQPGRKRWYLACKENVFTKHFYYEHRLFTWKEIDITDLKKYKIERKDFKISSEDLDQKFSSLLNDLIRKYAKPYITVGLLFGISFIESLSDRLKKYNFDKTDELLYYLHEEIEIIEKWKSWLELIPKPTETESVFFENL